MPVINTALQRRGSPLSPGTGSTSTHRAAIVLNATAPTLWRLGFHSLASGAGALLERKYDKSNSFLFENAGTIFCLVFFSGANRWNRVEPAQVTIIMCIRAVVIHE